MISIKRGRRRLKAQISHHMLAATATKRTQACQANLGSALVNAGCSFRAPINAAREISKVLKNLQKSDMAR
jgi:hypothetical protein